MKHILVLALMMSLALTGSMALAQPTKPFPDVPKDHWAYQAVMELKQKGILIGYPDGTFNGEGIKGKDSAKHLHDVFVSHKDELKLITRLRALEPWRNTTSYSQKNWDAQIALARDMQKMDERTIEKVLQDFADPARFPNLEYYEVSKAYLLLRVMFDLPEDAPSTSIFSFGGWTGSSEMISGDRANLSWPVSWLGGKPQLLAPCTGLVTHFYAPEKEYHYLIKHFSKRIAAHDSGLHLKLPP